MANYPDTDIGTNYTAKSEGVIKDVKAAIGEMAEPLKERAEQVAEDQKLAGTGHMRTLATAVHGAGRELEDGMPKIAKAVHGVAQQIEQTADGLRNRSMDDLFEDFDRYARRQPALVFGGALMAGFVLTRFLKSSAKPTLTPQNGTGEI
jgi:hypothetical protein